VSEAFERITEIQRHLRRTENRFERRVRAYQYAFGSHRGYIILATSLLLRS
jgi:hypothetical protein